MIIDQRPIKNIHGSPAKKSFPKTEEDKLQDETLKNVLLNCLSTYPIRDRKEIFYINTIATKLIENSAEINDQYKPLISQVLYEGTYKKDPKTGETSGIYLPYLIGQVYEMLGIKEPEETL